MIEEHSEKQIEALQSLDLNNQLKQPCQPQTKLIEDTFSKDHLNQETRWSKKAY